ncbi:short-chain dehydrogenase [Streptomyces sp. CB00455]|uniref:SDR family oxidoreductase n=1 Tax=Streptomyces sp. CB00455 TaxID=1703927 RepID=UPI00093BF5A1|nr:SDR family oxidoreductase [Streptomyces sp. CB00455]OKK14324.1 short-chain dehydrogenase [Streptomyces sp. CB00455]
MGERDHAETARTKTTTGPLGGKTALVTGASRGIGRGIAERLAADGAAVVVHYAQNGAAADHVVDSIRGRGGDAFAIRTELGAGGDAEALYAAVDTALEQRDMEPGLDILVNNAAVSGSARIHEVTPELVDKIFSVNVKSLLFVIKEALTRMREGGRIINVSSAVTRVAYPESIVYSMSKGAMDTLTLALAKELGPRRITVNTVSPGFVATDMNAKLRSTPEGAARLAGVSVFERIGEPCDIAGIVAFLASPDSQWITGQRLDASGGSHL